MWPHSERGTGAVHGIGSMPAFWSMAEHQQYTFMKEEHRTWPHNTPRRRLTTQSPDNQWSTRAFVDHGDGLSSGDSSDDRIALRHRACPNAEVEFASQQHAACQMGWLLCRDGDGVRMHERFGLRLQWLNVRTLRTTWAEMEGIGGDGHRRWTEKRQDYRVRLSAQRDDGPAGALCGNRVVIVEPIN